MNDFAQAPSLGPGHPQFPIVTQFVRVTGQRDSNGHFPAAVQQFDPNTNDFRDREPCLAFEPNLVPLVIGQRYQARLSGSWNNLPVMLVGSLCCGVGSSLSSSSVSLSSISSSSSSVSSSSLSSLSSSSLSSLSSLSSSSLIHAACCPNGVPPVLHVTISNAIGCACLTAVPSFPIPFIGTLPPGPGGNETWKGSTPVSCPNSPLTISVQCTHPSLLWNIKVDCIDPGIVGCSPNTSQCDPLLLVCNNVPMSDSGTCCNGTIDITITS